MAANSIKRNLDKSSIISSIRLMLGADIEKTTTVILVEGEDDWRFLRKFVSENVVIYESYSGKTGVAEVVNNQHIQCNRVIGIRDKDYLIRNGNDRIFFYDYSCLEMMLLKDDDVHNSVCNEFYDGEEPAEIIRENILKSIGAMSLLRKKNEQENLGIKFDGIPIRNLINNHHEFHFEQFCDELQNRNRQAPIRGLVEETTRQAAVVLNLGDLLEITNGHDYIACFQYHCNLYRNRGLSDLQISSNYRTSFAKEALQRTNFYNEIRSYEQGNAMNIWQ